MCLGIKMNPLQQSFLASGMFKPNSHTVRVGAATLARIALDLNECSSCPSCPSCPIGTFSTISWCFEVDAAWYQDESPGALFPNLNHDQTNPHAMWVRAVATPASLVLVTTSDRLAQVASLLHFQQAGGDLMCMRLGIKMNPLQHSFLASIMIKSTLIQHGLGL